MRITMLKLVYNDSNPRIACECIECVYLSEVGSSFVEISNIKPPDGWCNDERVREGERERE